MVNTHSDDIRLAAVLNRRTVAGRIGHGLVAMSLALALAACTTNPFTGEQKVSNTAKGAGIGAAGGALVGAIASGKRKHVLLAAGIGALAGAAAGAYMDRQEVKLRKQLSNTGVSVTRDGDNIILNMPGNITFATNSSDISADFYPVLSSVVVVVNEFDRTTIDITGHTDSRGAADYNQRLSEARALSVAGYLESQKVLPERILTRGLGEAAPVGSNATAQGRALNRRVEITLAPLT
jgi:outer membrane protein OmpA-like peptidoglycan-associated protein